MERNALAYTVGITVDLEDDGQRVRTRPVRVEVRAYVDEDEARRGELTVAYVEGAPGRPDFPWKFDGARKARALDDVRQSKIGRSLWPRRGRVQFTALADEPCWIPDLRLAMVVALHNAVSEEVDLDPTAIWHGGIPRGRPGRAPDDQDPTPTATPYTAHAVELARFLGVPVFGPDGPLRMPPVVVRDVPLPRPLPLTFATEVVACIATRTPIVVDPKHAPVVVSWCEWIQAQAVAAQEPGAGVLRRAVLARSSFGALRGGVPFPDVVTLGGPSWPAGDGAIDPPIDGLRHRATLGVVVAGPHPIPSGLDQDDDPTAPIVVRTAAAGGLSVVYDTDNPWVVPTEATAALLRSRIPGTAPQAFAKLARSMRVVQD